jgi:CheY-like chemotaxis protein
MRPPTILCVEDNKLILGALKEALELRGWTVEVCQDGITALARINTNEHYDLITFDNDLPGVSGLELLRHSRTLAHRQETPIIMLSASDIEREAWRAGANAFLRKPEDMNAIAETVTRLLACNPKPTGKGHCE